MSNRTIIILLVTTLFLTSCGSGVSLFGPTRTPYPTFTPTYPLPPTNTPVPTATKTPRPPTPTPTPFPAGSAIIDPENAAQLEVLDWPLYGQIRNAFFVMDGEDKLNSVLLTRTHLMSYALNGKFQYKLALPEESTFSSVSQLPSNISGDYRYIALPSLEENYTVNVSDLATGEVVYQLDHLVNFPEVRNVHYVGAITSVDLISLNQDGSLLAVVYVDNSISIWETANGVEHSLPRTFYDVQQIAFSEGNEFIAITTGSRITNLTIFNIGDLGKSELQLTQRDAGRLASRPFSQDNHYLLTTSTGLNPRYTYFDLEQMQLVERAEIPPDTSPIFSDGGNYIIFEPRAGAVEVELFALNLETQERTDDQEMINEILPEEVPYWVVLRDMRYDGDLFFSLQEIQSYQNTFITWSESQFYTNEEMTERQYRLEFWLSGKTARVLDLSVETDNQEETVYLLGKFGLSEDEIFYCWGTELRRESIRKSTKPVVLAENCASPGVVAYDPSYNVVAYPTSSDVVEIMDVESGETLFTLGGYTRDLAKLQFSADGSTLALQAETIREQPGALDISELMLFSLDYTTGNTEAVPLDNQSTVVDDYISEVEIASDGSILAVAVGMQDINRLQPKTYLWDFTGQVTQRRAIYGWAGSLALSPDNSILAVSTGETIRLYSAATSELLAEHNSPIGSNVEQVLFSQDGQSMFVVIDGAVSVWGMP